MSGTAPVLTRRQVAVYEYLLQRHQAGDSPPNVAEVCKALGVRPPGTMHEQVRALVEAGLLEPMTAEQGGLRLKAPGWREPVQLPLLGYIEAGHTPTT